MADAIYGIDVPFRVGTHLVKIISRIKRRFLSNNTEICMFKIVNGMYRFRDILSKKKMYRIFCIFLHVVFA